MEYIDTGEKEVHHLHKCRSEPKTHKTSKQSFTIADTLRFGEALFIDGAIQSTRADEGLYHSPLVHGSAAFLNCSPRNVLVIGGGEGCIVRELLRYGTIKSITQVDWDVELVDYFRNGDGISWNGGVYEDPRVKLVHEDVFETESIYKSSYDLIIVDLCDPSKDTIDLIKTLIVRLFGVLEEGGGLIMNGGEVLPICLYNRCYSEELVRFMDGFGSGTFAYKIYVPSYMEPWCLIGYSKKSTVGSWSLTDRRSIDDWLHFGPDYDPYFTYVNSQFHRQGGSRSGSSEELYGC